MQGDQSDHGENRGQNTARHFVNVGKALRFDLVDVVAEPRTIVAGLVGMVCAVGQLTQFRPNIAAQGIRHFLNRLGLQYTAHIVHPKQQGERADIQQGPFEKTVEIKFNQGIQFRSGQEGGNDR